MYQPLALLSPELVTALLENGFTLFVRQRYEVARNQTDHQIKEIFLITPYKNIGEANLHFQHIRFDARKYIYQSHHKEEIDKLYVAAAQPAGYKVYAALLQDEVWEPPLQLENRVRKYIAGKTSWKPDRKEKIDATLSLRYGELYCHLHYGEEELAVPLSVIEEY
ncbi:hypothetical protein [Chitinophaga nivalis]|uniref:Uncharacterized protein n=1 Tax=Chitinophaga nivalis TaxID=2991709 RepID=A0ABT3IFZ2_9BACT|nr:hypothetical protein [Chitinophaga nivalis]MCW3467583.1 hypothetical protein [Chitinophaga nivalis]MCW3482725.1 hypothetical protein [Chitinophaga nivalis]